VVELIQLDIPITEEFVGQIYGLFDIAIRSRVEEFLNPMHFEEGRSLNGSTLNEVSRIDTILVNFSIPEERYLEIVRPYLEGTDSVREQRGRGKQELTMVLADGSIYPHPGKLQFINRQVNATTGTILLQASFPNPSFILSPGQFALVRAVIDVKQNGLLIPQRCVQELQGNYSVFVVNDQNEVEFRSIEVGTIYRTSYFEVTSGLNPGERVVYEGLQKLKTGALVKPVVQEIPVGIPSELLQRRPDLGQAEQQFYAETARIGVAQAMRFPSFSITGALGLASADLSNLLSGESFIYSVGGSILGPIFNWGKNKRRVEIQQEVARQALYVYEQSVLNALREVDDALIDVSTYSREVESRERQKDAAKNAAILSRARYDGGQTAYLEVLDTERSLFTAELDATTVRRHQLSAYVYLYKALGGGWITPEDAE
jgi:hypothetical protein